MTAAKNPEIEQYLNAAMSQLKIGITDGVFCSTCRDALASPYWVALPAWHTPATWAAHVSKHVSQREIPLALIRLAMRQAHYMADGDGMWLVAGGDGNEAKVTNYDAARVRAALRKYVTAATN